MRCSRKTSFSGRRPNNPHTHRAYGRCVGCFFLLAQGAKPGARPPRTRLSLPCGTSLPPRRGSQPTLLRARRQAKRPGSQDARYRRRAGATHFCARSTSSTSSACAIVPSWAENRGLNATPWHAGARVTYLAGPPSTRNRSGSFNPPSIHHAFQRIHRNPSY